MTFLTCFSFFGVSYRSVKCLHGNKWSNFGPFAVAIMGWFAAAGFQQNSSRLRDFSCFKKGLGYKLPIFVGFFFRSCIIISCASPAGGWSYWPLSQFHLPQLAEAEDRPEVTGFSIVLPHQRRSPGRKDSWSSIAGLQHCCCQHQAYFFCCIYVERFETMKHQGLPSIPFLLAKDFCCAAFKSIFIIHCLRIRNFLSANEIVGELPLFKDTALREYYCKE